MKNKLNDIIKERLENRYEWKNYLNWLLTHKELQMQAKKDFYKDKFILNLILKLYFLPFRKKVRLRMRSLVSRYYFADKRVTNNITVIKLMKMNTIHFS